MIKHAEHCYKELQSILQKTDNIEVFAYLKNISVLRSYDMFQSSKEELVVNMNIERMKIFRISEKQSFYHLIRKL